MKRYFDRLNGKHTGRIFNAEYRRFILPKLLNWRKILWVCVFIIGIMLVIRMFPTHLHETGWSIGLIINTALLVMLLVVLSIYNKKIRILKLLDQAGIDKRPVSAQPEDSAVWEREIIQRALIGLVLFVIGVIIFVGIALFIKK